MFRDRGEINLNNLVPVALLGVIALGVSEYKGWTDFTDFIDVPPIELGSDPEEAVASVDQESYAIELDLDITCTKRVSAAVNVESFKNGPIGDGVVEKKIFGDFLLCGDNQEVEGSAVESIHPITNEVQSITVTVSGLYVEQPRVDMLDVRNCIDGNIDDNIEDINQKVDEYHQKVADGDKPGCDDGFRVSQLGGTDNLAKAKDIALASAQLALTVDSNPVEILKAADEEYKLQILDRLSQNERYDDAEIVVNVIRPDDTESVQDRIDGISEDLRASFTKVEFGTNDDGDYMYVERADGSRATVQLGGYAELEVNELGLTTTARAGSATQVAVAGG
jgi:hypothetical protein